ncbi:MAG: peptidoglycan DD-metalloendopeptidase family protein [Thermodesulfobacteriota bacterium]
MTTVIKAVCRKKTVRPLVFKANLNFIIILTGIFFILWSNTLFASNFNYNNKLHPQITLQNIPDIQIIHGVVKRGDTATSLLEEYLSLRSIYEIDKQSTDIFSLTRIRKGQPYKVILQNNNLVGFEYEIDEEDKLVVQKKQDSFYINQEPIKYDVKIEVVSASITSSLFEAVRKSGEGGELAMKLADIFAWDIDFIREIQSKDQFKVLVEKRYRNGKFSGYGKILAAFFTNKGIVFKAFLHKDSKGISGYYDENGKSLQKAFLKAPLTFSRISSKFTKKRFHPVLKVYRPHHGIDYAASKGTPIKTVGDGTIEQIGYNKGRGNYIKIRHNNGYTTSYYHMCKFGRNMKKNRRVMQGDIIGYVGMTGYATGPHLCFRMKKNGSYVNPLKHKSPPAKPVKTNEMEQFIAKTILLSNRLLAEQQLASLKN